MFQFSVLLIVKSSTVFGCIVRIIVITNLSVGFGIVCAFKQVVDRYIEIIC